MFYFEVHIHEQNILTLMWKQTKYMYKCFSVCYISFNIHKAMKVSKQI